MKIDKIDIMPADMPQADPKWRFAIHANRVSRCWLVAIGTDEGILGHGYASATKHMGASSEGLKGVLDDFISLLIGRDPFDIEAIMADLDHRLRGTNQAKAAIDCALHDLNARALGVPLNVLFGGPVRDSVPILRILAIKTPAEMAAWSLAIAQGLNIRAFTGVVLPYPTLSEIGKRAAIDFFAPSLTRPWVRRIIALLRCFG